ncbi:MAG: hypothetical protein CBC79_03865 [Gammaproteobacteria bacterium TMED119]|nr:MAG: hypothetical protein CBC79_03865 [Gammaproteobacteria bacterium TMED119]RCL44628.1 MAG: hypothetical protein DBW91_05970 [Candidatus Thioglobus sp.]|tara:strand:+ start:6523 stop:7110 length:588 start_codon:yes stop_codon:yes gene_type:complete
MSNKKTERAGLYLIAVFVGPLLIAIVMYSMREHLPSLGSVSKGELIHPAQPIEAISLNSNQQTVFDFADFDGKWTYIVYQSQRCDLECEAALFKLRQARLATGRDSNRVQALLAYPNNQQFEIDQSIVDRHQKIKVGALSELKMSAEVEQAEQLESGYVYLVDPNGNLMMKYNHMATSRGLLKDIKKLLKISNIG